jgi:hypothetical protein
MNLTQGMSYAPKIIHNLRVLLERRDSAVLRNKFWMEEAALEVAWTILNHPVAGSIIVRASRECVLSWVFMLKGPTRYTQTMT